MRRFLPRSLAGQTIIVLLLGLGLSHLLSMMIFNADRNSGLALFSSRPMIEQIAAITRLLDETPPQWRERILQATDSPALSVIVSSESRLSSDKRDGIANTILTQYLSLLLDSKTTDQVVVAVYEVAGHDSGITPMPRMHSRMMQTLFHSHASGRILGASVQLRDGIWLNFNTELPERGSIWSTRAVLSMLLMGIAVIVFSLWLIQRLTRPLRVFAAAAEHLGKDMETPPMVETGPLEVRQATRAFNEMQERLRRLVENRTQMLAAISHDLRTPITLLRLRLESVEDHQERTRMLSTLDTMDSIITSTLSFAHEDARNEATVEVDLGALLGSICDDMSDAGFQVECDPPTGIIYRCRPNGLQRALTNLIENAVKYGDVAKVELRKTPANVEFVITDSGPGIPEAELDKVFAPFYRVEKSRNAETGGAGLGLSVTRSVIDKLGGVIELKNLSEGGLQVRILLPR
jgi:signal transduction histidine kinase